MIDGSGTINPAHLNTPGKEDLSPASSPGASFLSRCTLAGPGDSGPKQLLYAQRLRTCDRIFARDVIGIVQLKPC